MYSLKVKSSQANEASTSGTATPTATRLDQPPALDSEIEEQSVSWGNPRVEHITGVIHLYKHHSNAKDPTTTDSAQICILSIPPDMGFPELCAFLGAYTEHTLDIRLVRRENRCDDSLRASPEPELSSSKSSCLVLITFDSETKASEFYTDFNDKPFCILEPEFICRLLFVKEVEITPPRATTAPLALVSSSYSTKTTSPQTAPPSNLLSSGVTELPSCPVCLERLDSHVSGIVTTVCNHKFHNQCLRQWGDNTCPVCRYCQQPAENASHCNTCNTSADLWICLICGNVGCGRYRGSHAAAHWQSSGHGYALEIQTQRVWDYASDAYVHRLVRSKTDGKLVEVPAPEDRCCGAGEGCRHHSSDLAECSGSGAAGIGGHNHSGQYVTDEKMEEALVISKLDALATEYNHLLVSQLESQRQHFEGLLVRQEQELSGEMEELRKRYSEIEENKRALEKKGNEGDRQRQKLEDKLAATQKERDRICKEKEFLKQLNDTLLANQKEFAVKLNEAELKATAQEGMVQELQEQVRDLMVFIEARDTIVKEGGDVEGGTVLPVEVRKQRRNKGKGRT